MSSHRDHCTGFPEYWYNWKLEVVYIGDICEKHDERCGSHGFYRDTWNNNLIGAVAIATVASIACWIKYSKLMWGKL